MKIVQIFFLLSTGVYLGLVLPIWLSKSIRYFQNRKILKDLIPGNVKEEKLCKGPHSWITAPTYTANGDGTAKVCQVCGFIPTVNKMATPEAIDAIQENIRITELNEKIYQDFVNKEGSDIQKYFNEELKNGVSLEKLTQLHCAGITFNARYNVYKSAKAGEIEKELKKSDA